MTPHLAAWKADAAAKEIPANIQKAMVFFTTIYARLRDTGSTPEEFELEVSRITDRLDDDSIDVYQSVDFPTIGNLIYEAAQKANPELLSGVYADIDGTERYVFNRFIVDRLPPLEALTVGSCATLIKSLYEQIGECILDSDPDVWAIAGVEFFELFVQLDRNTTAQMCNLVTKIVPTHMKFSWWCFNTSLFENHFNDDAFTNTLGIFFADSLPSTKQLIEQCFGDFYQIKAWREVGIDVEYEKVPTDLMAICREQLLAMRVFVQLPYFQALVEPAVEEIKNIPKVKPMSDDIDQALLDLQQLIAEGYGYTDFFEGSSHLYKGERYDRLCCILLMIMVEALDQLPRRLQVPVTPEQFAVAADFSQRYNFIIENNLRLQELKDQLGPNFPGEI